jgi:signal transduction histidine kinase
MKTSADSLLTIINDILDFSKIEAGRMELDSVCFPLRHQIDSLLAPLAVRAQEKGLHIACEIDSDIPDWIVGDPVRFGQILVNLLGNAVKFTDRGEVRLSAGLELLEDDYLWLHFVVSDTGIGIPPERQDTIFEAFSQADGSTTRRFGGTGLGLTISSRLATAMHGRIWVESQVGRGSRFHFTALFGRAAASALPD